MEGRVLPSSCWFYYKSRCFSLILAHRLLLSCLMLDAPPLSAPQRVVQKAKQQNFLYYSVPTMSTKGGRCSSILEAMVRERLTCC